MARGIQIVTAAPKVARRQRHPQHSFQLRQRAWTVQPFLIAPVLPGETMKNALVQTRVTSPLVTSETAGWWYEQYYFYVKHRDLLDDDETDAPAQAMMALHLGEGTLAAAVEANPTLNHGVGAADFTRWCLNSVVHHYFRSEGEGVWQYESDGLPVASILQNSWLDSLSIDGEGGVVADDQLPGEYPVMPDFVDPMFAGYFTQWQAMTAQGYYSATFADYLRSFGVRPPRELLRTEIINKPELIRYVRDWQMPQPSMTGEATGFNVRWNIAERIEKDRFFAEPLTLR